MHAAFDEIFPPLTKLNLRAEFLVVVLTWFPVSCYFLWCLLPPPAIDLLVEISHLYSHVCFVQTPAFWDCASLHLPYTVYLLFEMEWLTVVTPVGLFAWSEEHVTELKGILICTHIHPSVVFSAHLRVLPSHALAIKAMICPFCVTVCGWQSIHCQVSHK